MMRWLKWFPHSAVLMDAQHKTFHFSICFHLYLSHSFDFPAQDRCVCVFAVRCGVLCCLMVQFDSDVCISHGVVLSLILIKHIHLLLFLSQRISSLADSYCLPFLPSFFSVTTTFSFFCFLSFYFCLHISLEPWLHDDFIDSRGGAFYAML